MPGAICATIESIEDRTGEIFAAINGTFDRIDARCEMIFATATTGPRGSSSATFGTTREICGLIAEYFSGEGYRVSSVGDGQAMRRVIAQQPVDLILLDLGLPGEGGLELAQWIRANSDIRIIILSGRGETVDRTIDVQVGRLRRKLQDDSGAPRLIKSVRGAGYIFTPIVEAADPPVP